MDDEIAYSKVLQGSEQAFRCLYDRYSSVLFRFIIRFTANAQQAEEILHDVFAELLAGKFKYEEEASLKNWLFTVAKNKSLNHCKKSRREVASLKIVEATPSEHELELQMINNDLASTLLHAEKSLPQDLGKTWELRKQGMDYAQIADTLAIPVGTVKSRFHRIVKILRKDFGSYET